MNKYPLWKYLLLGVVFVAGFIFALPNLFGDDQAVQIASRHATLEEDFEERTRTILSEGGFTDIRLRMEGERMLALFDNSGDQLRAKELLEDKLNNEEAAQEYVIALNLVSAAPSWLRGFAKPMYLGLDLRGGVHFLMEVDMVAALNSAEERYVGDWKARTRKARIRGSNIQHKDGQLVARFKNVEQRDEMLAVFREEGQDLEFLTREEDGLAFIDANLTELAAETERKTSIQQNIITLRNRVNELGVAEPIIQQQGVDRIVVQLPGVQDPGRAREILGATATLEYRLVHGTATDWFAAGDGGSVPADAKLYKQREDGSPILLKRDIIVTGDQIKDASAGIDQQSGTPAVFVNLDNRGASRMQAVTAENVGNLMAVVYIENQVKYKEVNGETERSVRRVEEVINAATIRDVLSHRFQTTGLMSKEASDLALLLRSGALKAPVEIVEERTVGPSLGADNIRQGFMSAVVGLAIVLVFMAFYYRVFGVIAGIALVVNLMLIIAVLSSLQATLTLPGIAGIVLTTGMAVDANVLIFERIREELKSGSSIQASIDAGYDKAFITIADANITTLIAAIVLFGMGTGPIKGFAITLCIGILTSMFTAIVGTRGLVNYIYGGKRVRALAI